MNILAIDTSNKAMSVALMGKDQVILEERTTNVKRNHSIQLMPTIDSMMKSVGWVASDLDRVAVAKGPGSYTGVRIAVTVAKTLAWTTGIELVGVSSLKTLAGNASLFNDQLICPLFDARRKNIYTGLYKWDSNGQLVQVEKDTHISAEEWAEYLKSFKQPVEFMGEDVQSFKDLFQSKLNTNFRHTSNSRQFPRASVLAEIALSEEPVNIHTFVPEYLKLTEAEENWRKEHPKDIGGELVEKI